LRLALRNQEAHRANISWSPQASFPKSPGPLIFISIFRLVFNRSD
jgi:hypothetical protein